MTDELRNRLRIRAKQDRIIELAEARHINEDLQISSLYAGSPTVRDLRHYIWPEWELALDAALVYLGEEGNGNT